MKGTKKKKGNAFPRALIDEQLKAARGGTNSPTPSPADGGNDQSPDARAIVIDLG
jgi:hypothetical protein